MSRRGNCHDNAVVESFFQLLKREGIKRKTMPAEQKQGSIYLITSNCFTTRLGAIVTTMGFLR